MPSRLGDLSRERVDLNELHPELRSRVAAAAGQATNVEVSRDGPGYRVRAESGHGTVEMYLELRSDGSVREETTVHPEPRSGSEAREPRNGPGADRDDEHLIEQISAALFTIVAGAEDPADRRDQWRSVIDNIREIERRYPPESGPS